MYSIGPWLPPTANMEQFPFRIREVGRDSYFLRSKAGVFFVMYSAWIKELEEALIYSYVRELLTCLWIGFSVWWFSIPEQLLVNPRALSSPDLELVVRVVRDTFQSHVCCSHHVPSPCECGELLNKATQDLFAPKEPFDPPWFPTKVNNANLKKFVFRDGGTSLLRLREMKASR